MNIIYLISPIILSINHQGTHLWCTGTSNVPFRSTVSLNHLSIWYKFFTTLQSTILSFYPGKEMDPGKKKEEMKIRAPGNRYTLLSKCTDMDWKIISHLRFLRLKMYEKISQKLVVSFKRWILTPEVALKRNQTSGTSPPGKRGKAITKTTRANLPRKKKKIIKRIKINIIGHKK